VLVAAGLLVWPLASAGHLAAQATAPRQFQRRSTAADLKRQAQAYEAAQRIREAEAAYETYLQRNPEDVEARLNLGHLYSQDKSYEKALEQFRIILATKPHYLAALLGKARVLAWQGHYGESLQSYDEALAIQPDNSEAEAGKAFVLLWSGHPGEAQRLFSELHQRYPRDAEVAKGLEQAQATLQEKNLAATHHADDASQLEARYRERLAGNPNDSEALKALATLTVGAQRCAESIQYGRRALELSPSDLSLEMILARSLAACGQVDEALARYRRFLSSQPRDEAALAELGDLLLGARRFVEALEVFRDLVRVNPQDAKASLGLARALARTGNFAEALLRYDEALKTLPENYDALQGKAFVLYWTQQFSQARAIFQKLVARQPDDPENAEAVRNIARAEEEARWAALRPAPNALPQAFADFYEKWLARHPDDSETLKKLAIVQSQMKDFSASLQSFRRVLELDPNDRQAKLGLARLLSAQGEYDAALALYQDALKDTPHDPQFLEGLASLDVKLGRLSAALPIFEALSVQFPSKMGYRVELARVQSRLGRYREARRTLAGVLVADPKNHEARLLYASLALHEGRLRSSLDQFNQLLKENPDDFAALLGNARAYYYRGDLEYSHALVTKLVEEHPGDFDAVFLLANLERALHNRRKARAALAQANRLSPNNAEVQNLETSLREESRVTLHTSASFAREIGTGSQLGNATSSSNEDLRAFAYESTVGFSVLPRSDSYLSLYYLPSNSPSGGIRGAVAPGQFLYRQTTWVSSRLTLRGGAGLARFGPGNLQNVPGQTQPVPAAQSNVVGYAGASYALRRKIRVDLNAARSAIPYTPTSVRLGVMESRLDGGLDFRFNPRTNLRLECFFARYSSVPYEHVSIVNRTTRVVTKKSDHDEAYNGSVTFDRNLFRSERLSFDLGYAGLAYGYAGRRRNIFVGMFNPAFYQRHYLTTHLHGKLWGPIRYDFSGGVGLQQVEQRAALTRALLLSPALTFKMSSRFSLTAGYIHYNSAQSLGILRGNAVRLTTEWAF
jgi:tetratricopeptide (TPR) repeat protein